MTATSTDLDREIDAALEQHGLRARQIVPISPLKSKRGRVTCRVDAEDGRRVKLRYLGSHEEARRLYELRAGLEPAFVPALAQYGAVLVEEWIEGSLLVDGDADAWAEEAGALLGRLHATPLGAEAPPTCSTWTWMESTESDLGILADAGRVSPDEAARLRAELGRLDPGSAPSAVIHRDFCAENMLIDDHGRLRVIDNEWFMIGPAGFDLGRTYHRWPMSDGAWERFCRAYASATGPPEALEFWILAAAAFGARVFHQVDPARLDPLLVLLRGFFDREGRPETTKP
jgi:phosphotransferase family enzyme